jgi:hypothetical protein
VSTWSICKDVFVALHFGRVFIELFDFDVSEPFVNVLVTDLDAWLMHIRKMVHTKWGSKIIILDSEAFHGDDVIGDLELETLASFTDEALFNNDDPFFPITLVSHVLFVDGDFGFLLNIDFVWAVRLISLSRSVEIGGPILVEC